MRDPDAGRLASGGLTGRAASAGSIVVERWDVPGLVGGGHLSGSSGSCRGFRKPAEGQCAPRRSAAVLRRERQPAAV